MVRRLFRDSAIYAATALFTQGVAFLLFPFLAHTLDPRAYGVIDIVGVLTMLALLTVALEINQGLGRLIALGTPPAERAEYASTALIWSVASYTVLAVIGLVLATPLTHLLLGRRVDVWVMRTALVGVWSAGALYLVQDQLRWQMRPRAFVAVSATVAVLTTGSTAIYVFVLGGRALGVIAGQLTGATAGLAVGLALSRGIYRLHFDWRRAKSMLAFSIPLVPSSVGVLLGGYADRLVIQHDQSLRGVGLYGVGFRVAAVVALLISGVQAGTAPQVISRHGDPETPAELARVLRWFWAAGCAGFVVLSVLAEPLVRLLSSTEYFPGAHVVPYLVAATFLAGLYVFAPGPTISGRTRAFAAVNVAAGALNVGLALLLVPRLGILGAGVATASSSAFVFAATMTVSQRLYPVPHDWLRLALGAGAAVAVVVAARVLLVTGPGDTLDLAPILARIGICVLGTAAVAAILVDGHELRRLRRLLNPRVLAR